LYVQLDISGKTRVEPAPLRVTAAGEDELLTTVETTLLVTTDVCPLPVTVEVTVLVPPETATYAPTAMITITITTTATRTVVARALRLPKFFPERDLAIHNTEENGFPYGRYV